MKNLIYLVFFVLISCSENQKSLGSDKRLNEELTTEDKHENASEDRESSFDCHIKYMDAIFLQKPSDCDNPRPFQLTKDSITSLGYGDIDLLKVVLYLDSLTGRQTQFEFNLGTFGAQITNYSDSLYALERKAWIVEYEKKTPHNKR